MEQDQINESLMDLIFTGIDYGVEILQDTNVLLPFVFLKYQDEKNLHRFEADRFEEALEEARKFLEQEKNYDFAVLIYDGIVTIDDKKYDSIIANGMINGEKTTYIFCQSYQPKRLLKKFKTIGNIGYLGKDA